MTGRPAVELVRAPAELPERWRQAADMLRGYGAEPQAVALERCAEDLERTLVGQAGVLLTLAEAARCCGYSADHLGRLVRRGVLPNLGRPHRPLVRRGDLPKKPAKVAGAGPALYDVAADARALSAGRKGAA